MTDLNENSAVYDIHDYDDWVFSSSLMSTEIKQPKQILNITVQNTYKDRGIQTLICKKMTKPNCCTFKGNA